MHHESRIPLRLHTITSIVMNTVPIKSKRRVPKQQQIIRINDALPRRSRADLQVRSRPRRSKLAINNIMLLRQRDPPWRTDLMPHDDKHQLPTTPLLFLHADNPRQPSDRIPHKQRMMKFEPAPSPHPSWQIDRRQKPTALRMPIRPELRLPLRRKKIQPVPQGRHRIPRTRWRIRAIESGRERLQRPRSYLIVPCLFTADPFLISQVV